MYLNFFQLYHIFKGLLRCSTTPFDVIAFTSISLGLVYVGSCNEDVAEAIKIAFTIRKDSELGNPLSRFLPLGLGLLYLGRQVTQNTVLELNIYLMKYTITVIFS